MRCSLEPTGAGYAPDDLFDSARQAEQITVTTDGRIELETEWKPFRVQCHRKADPGHAGAARRMRVPGQEDVRDILTADLELPLIFDPRRCTGSDREEQRIYLSESSRRKPSAQLLSVRLQRSEVLLVGDVP